MDCRENQIGRIIVDAAVQVHKVLGPGLLESVYEVCLAHELRRRGLHVERQVPVPIRYEDVVFDVGFRADLLVEGLIFIELKSVESLNAAHRKQAQTQVRLAQKRLGFLLNFGQALMKDGIVRIANGLPDS